MKEGAPVVLGTAPSAKAGKKSGVAQLEGTEK
jgi:hypothetical protein